MKGGENWILSIKKGNNALSFLAERSVVQESPLYTGDSCIRRNDILCKEFPLPLNIEWILKIYIWREGGKF